LKEDFKIDPKALVPPALISIKKNLPFPLYLQFI